LKQNPPKNFPKTVFQQYRDAGNNKLSNRPVQCRKYGDKADFSNSTRTQKMRKQGQKIQTLESQYDRDLKIKANYHKEIRYEDY